MTKLTERHQKTAGLTGLKANETAGEFTAIVAVFGNVDLGGDRIVPGAFTKSLAAWKASGDPIPVLWNHERSNPLAHIGKVLEAKEVAEGLWIRAALDVHKPFAKQVSDLLAERRVKEFSFAYAIKDAEQKGGVYELKELDLIEVGPTLQGMNPATQLLAVKSWTEAEAAAHPRDADLLARLALLKGAKPDTHEEEVARIFRRLGIPLPGKKSAAPQAKKPPVLKREPQRVESGAYLGGLPGRPPVADHGTAHQYVTGGFQLIDLDEQLADAEIEAERAAKRAAEAAERLEAAREAVKRADALRASPDAA